MVRIGHIKTTTTELRASNVTIASLSVETTGRSRLGGARGAAAGLARRVALGLAPLEPRQELALLAQLAGRPARNRERDGGVLRFAKRYVRDVSKPPIFFYKARSRRVRERRHDCRRRGLGRRTGGRRVPQVPREASTWRLVGQGVSSKTRKSTALSLPIFVLKPRIEALSATTLERSGRRTGGGCLKSWTRS